MLAAGLQDIVLDAGGEVVGVFTTALAGIGAVGVIHPDVVLMDIRLVGEMDGIDAAGIIRARRPTAVVFITGAPPDADAKARLAMLGPVEIVPKPIKPAMLCAAILRAHTAGAAR